MKNQAKTVDVAGILCCITAFILEVLPYGVAMIFSDGPNKKIVRTYSYFSLMPFGYGEYAPLAAGLLTLAAAALILAAWWRRTAGIRLRRKAVLCAAFAAVFSLLTLLPAPENRTAVGCAVTVLLAASAALEGIAANLLHREKS